jgi:hypothetical protein
MAWRRRSIRMTGRFDPARWEITAGMGVREIVLVSAAAGQAIWLVFMTPALPFVVRLVIAVLLALVLFGIALVPIKDKPIEYHLLKFIGYRMRAMGRVYRTARRDDVRVGQGELTEVAEPVTRLVSAQRVKPQRIARVREWQWVHPDSSLMLAMFMCVLITASAFAFMGKELVTLDAQVSPEIHMTSTWK